MYGEISQEQICNKVYNPQNCASHCITYLVSIIPLKIKYKLTLTMKVVYNLVNKANLVHSFSWYVYFFPLHVLGDYVPIKGRNKCIYATLGTCHSVLMTAWYAGSND